MNTLELKKAYEEAKMKIVLFSTADVITTSLAHITSRMLDRRSFLVSMDVAMCPLAETRLCIALGGIM